MSVRRMLNKCNHKGCLKTRQRGTLFCKEHNAQANRLRLR